MNPKTRILIVSKTEALAGRLLKQITNAIENELKETEGFELTKPKTKTELRLKINTNKEASITACGVGGSVTGMHYDFILCDDIIDEMNTGTSSGRKKVWEWFTGSLLQLALPKTRLLVLGTRKHPEDIYGKLLKNPAWSREVESAIIKYPDNIKEAIEKGESLGKFFKFSPEGKLKKVIKTGSWKTLWGKEWNINRLLLDRYLSGGLMFDREKQNDVTAMSGSVFKAKWIRRYVRKPDREDMDIFLACDLAISEKENADRFSLVVVGINRNGNWFLLDEVSGRYSFLAQTQLIARKVEEWNPLRVGIEDVGYQRVMVERIRDLVSVPVVSISHGKCSKVSRIRTLQPLFEEGRIYVGDGFDGFVSELLDFPNGSHDDRIDAFEMAVGLGTQSMGRARVEFV